MIVFRNIVIYTFVSTFLLSAVFLFFVNADQYDALVTDFKQEDMEIDIVKKIEISDYYGITSLLVNLHLELGRGIADEE
jgi:hypothetical protein